jgi:D-proline reductase (dithiol) PrdB
MIGIIMLMVFDCLMSGGPMEVDSFKYLSRLITRYYKMAQVQTELPIPWTPLSKPLSQSRFGLITSGGLYHRGYEPPFDLERERQNPTWGDPSYRTLPAGTDPKEIDVSHLHLNAEKIEQDINILLPLKRFQELVQEGRIQSQAAHAYSFMGYQGYPADQTGWMEQAGPQVAEKLLAEGVDNVLLTAA